MATDNNSEGWSIWEAIGGLRANVQRLIEGQQRQDRRLDETNERMDHNFERLDRKIDRVSYTMIGIGGTMIGIGGTIIGLLIVLIVGS